MKILYVTTIGVTMNFFKQLIKELIDKGNIVDVATNTDIADVDDYFKKLGCKIYRISCQRTPFSMKNIKAINEIKGIVSNNHYDIVHCHTPVASFCTRLACINYRKNGGKVIYTCHGFHFHKKSSKLNWILYYTAEKFLARYADLIITINKEDYNVTKKFNVKDIKYIHGVGIDCKKISNLKVNNRTFRKSLSIPQNAFLLTSIGELSKRKNFSVVIKAMSKLKEYPIYYVICGEGSERANLEKLINDNYLNDKVILLGRKDHDFVLKLCKVSDVGIIPSKIEGLGLAGLEHMAAGKPVIGSNLHGIKDYVINGYSGILCESNNSNQFSNAIINMFNNKQKYNDMCLNAENISRKFDQSISIYEMKTIYNDIIS